MLYSSSSFPRLGKETSTWASKCLVVSRSVMDEVVVAAASFTVLSAGYVLRKKKKKAIRRRWWMLSLSNSRRRYDGSSLLADLSREPTSGQFFNFCRMSTEDFHLLLSKVEPLIAKKNTKWREAVASNVRLAITLRFLATGDSFRSLQYLFKVSHQLISTIVADGCKAIIHVLREEYVKMPSSQEEWRNVAQGFEDIWDFPLCIGALDGKHVMVQAPRKSGSDFFNYKQFFSIVLMGLVDANYCFLFAECGCQGRLSDGAVYKNTLLCRKIDEEQLNFPSDHQLLGIEQPMPYVIVSDDAFPLSRRMMKPFPGLHDQGSRHRIFNYRLSRARRVVENAFGIMANVFRVLRKPMLLEPDKASAVVMACVCLHNFLRRSNTSRQLYTPPGSLDSENAGNVVNGSWRQSVDSSSMIPLPKIPRRASTEAREIRERFAEYFVDTGRVPWQDEYA